MAKLKFDWSLLKNRSKLGRDLMLERLVKQNQKQQIVAYTLWILLGGIGAHRMYLGHWRQAFTLIAFNLFVMVGSFMLASIGLSDGLAFGLIMLLFVIAIGVFVYEGVRLYSFVRKWNEEFRQEIETQMAFV